MATSSSSYKSSRFTPSLMYKTGFFSLFGAEVLTNYCPSGAPPVR
jgi:hypothetical protein